jgi:hypothetical protein
MLIFKEGDYIDPEFEHTIGEKREEMRFNAFSRRSFENRRRIGKISFDKAVAPYKSDFVTQFTSGSTNERPTVSSA